jgi:outer membrane protein OmpA-like peptidoglycan-associated protein
MMPRYQQALFVAAALAVVGLTTGGCATTAPAQLVQARDSYTVSSTGLAAKLSPTELYDAKKALDRANKEFENHGDTVACRDDAYIAQRKIELADVKARTEQDRLKILEAQKAMGVAKETQATNTTAALAATREELNLERRDNDATSAQLDKAMKDLATVATVKEESRGVVVSLSGSVLFASGQYALLNTAMTRLDQVASALRAQDADKRSVVEGHTDSRGSDAINQPLSVNRANAVRDYLVGHGVDPAKISAIGFGSSHPIVNNDTAENRSNNRRVEIVIGNATVSQR